jgi:hypothetical protein
MQLSALTWPTNAASIQASAEMVTNQVGTTMNDAVGRLTPLKSDANFSLHPLSTEAQGLSGLRSNLESLLNNGTVLSVTPYQFQVGEKQNSGIYLNPQTAVKKLTAKLRDHVDKNRPAGELYCIAIMVSETKLTTFASKLNKLVAVLQLPDWCQVARQSKALSKNSVDKLHQPASIIQPRFKPQAKLNANPLRELLKQQGKQIATLESLANDSINVIDKLQALATKRASQLNEANSGINALKALTGSIYTMAISGTAESIATQLSQASVPNNNQHTIASLLISNQPLSFFEELLC